MRYIYLEPVLTKISDETLTDDNTILELFDNFKKNGIRFSIIFKDHDYNFKKLDTVVIKSIDKENKKIKILGLGKTGNCVYELEIYTIEEIKVVSSKTELSKKYANKKIITMDIPEF